MRRPVATAAGVIAPHGTAAALTHPTAPPRASRGGTPQSCRPFQTSPVSKSEHTVSTCKKRAPCLPLNAPD